MTTIAPPVGLGARGSCEVTSTVAARTDRRRSFVAGARAMLPLLVGIVPFGIAIGVTIAERDISPLAGVATGWMIYAGSAQLAVIELIDAGAAPIFAIGAALAVNARLVFYSGAMAPRWRGASGAWKAIAAYLLVDPSFAVGSEGYAKRDVVGHAYYLGGAVTLWVSWQAAIVFGLTAGDVVPASLHLEFAVPLYLVAMVVTRATSRPAQIAAVAAGVAAVVGGSLPMRTGLVVAIVVGVAVGFAAQRQASGARPEPRDAVRTSPTPEGSRP